jgi:hypothetical protein
MNFGTSYVDHPVYVLDIAVVDNPDNVFDIAVMDHSVYVLDIAAMINVCAIDVNRSMWYFRRTATSTGTERYRPSVRRLESVFTQ